MFAGFAGGTTAADLSSGTDTDREDAEPSKLTLIATDSSGEGYIAQFAARHWDDGGGAEVHYEFNYGRDVAALPVIDEYHELPRAPIAGDVFEMEIVRASDGVHTITLYFNGDEIDSATSSAFDMHDFAVFGSPMDNNGITDPSAWRPGVVATWITTGDHWRPDRPASAGSGSGDVVGPASSVTGYPALFDGTTGKLLQQGTGTLGTAAYAAIGSSSGQVAAGNHTHTGLIAAGQDEGTATSNINTDVSLLDSAPTVTATAGDMLRVDAFGTYLNDSGSARTPTLKLKLGSTTVLSFGVSVANNAAQKPQ
jgi:hypothetical protein